MSCTPYAYYSFWQDSLQILNTRSAHLETDYVSLTVSAGPKGGPLRHW
jgi:hypothetical protein